MKLVDYSTGFFYCQNMEKCQNSVYVNLEKCQNSVGGNLRKVPKFSVQIKTLYYINLILLIKDIITYSCPQVNNYKKQNPLSF